MAILGIFVLLAVLLLFFQGQLTGQAVQESAQRSLLKCGDTISQKTHSPIVLTEKDIITQAPCRNGDGLKITGFNKVLDCKGLAITGATNRFSGIEIKSSSGNTIRNCKISGFETGIKVSYANKNTFSGNVLESDYWGMVFDGHSKNNIITANFFSSEEADILWQTYGSKNVLYGNDFFGTQTADLRKRQLPQVCEKSIGNYLAPGTQEPLQLQAKSSCGISKEPFTKEGKERSK